MSAIRHLSVCPPGLSRSGKTGTHEHCPVETGRVGSRTHPRRSGVHGSRTAPLRVASGMTIARVFAGYPHAA
jgi:hypothetical protein